MEFLQTQAALSSRLSRGSLLLASSHQVDTQPVAVRLRQFRDIHSEYLAAQSAVEQAQKLEVEQGRRTEVLDRELDRAIRVLSAALLIDGEPSRNTFARFSPLGPRAIARLAYAAFARTVLELATLVQGSRGSAATVDAAEKAEQAASALADNLAGLELRRTYTALMRRQRDSMHPRWDTAFSSLRHATKAVHENPDLYTALFPYQRRRKKAAREQAETPATPATAAAPATTSDPPRVEAATSPPLRQQINQIFSRHGAEIAAGAKAISPREIGAQDLNLLGLFDRSGLGGSAFPRNPRR